MSLNNTEIFIVSQYYQVIRKLRIKMSTYQYYEFRTVDRLLTESEQAEINTWSSRSMAGSNMVSFEYNYGDFKKDMEEAMWDYFDIGLYMANWGSRRLIIKLPLKLVDYQHLELYDIAASYYLTNELRILKNEEHVLVDMNLNEEGGGYWLYGEGRLAELVELRSDILNEDYRSLFIIWLELVRQTYESDKLGKNYSFRKSLIPPNLKQLSQRLTKLMDFFEIGIDWVNGVAKYSLDKIEADFNYKEYLKDLDSKIKEDYLHRLLEGEYSLDKKLKHELKSRFKVSEPAFVNEGSIPLSEFLEQVNLAEIARDEAERLEKERLHSIKMKEVKENKVHLESELERHILRSNASGYKIAVTNLLDLRSLSEYEKKQEEFSQYLKQIVDRHRRKQTFIKRLREAGLID